LHHFADVAAEPDGFAVLKGFHSDFLHKVGFDVEVFDDIPADDVAESIDGEGTADRAGFTGVIDEADVIIDGDGHVFLGELFGSHLTVAVEVLILVMPLPIEGLRRRAEMDGKHSVDDAEHFVFCLAEGSELGAVLCFGPEGACIFAEFMDDELVHSHGGG